MKPGQLAEDLPKLKSIIQDLNQEIADRDARIAELTAAPSTPAPTPEPTPGSTNFTAEDEAAADWIDQFVQANAPAPVVEDTAPAGAGESNATPTTSAETAASATPLEHA